jgi:hypothetical protein
MFCKVKNFCPNIWMTSSKCIVNWFHSLVFIKVNIENLPCSFFFWTNNLHKNKFNSLYTQVSRNFDDEEKVSHIIVSYMPQPLHIHVLQQNYMPPFDFQCGPNTCCPTNSKTKWFIFRFKYIIYNNFDKFAFMNRIDQGMEINNHMIHHEKKGGCHNM